MTLRSILVSLDGSRFAETALPVAARLARSAAASLNLAMVHEPVMAMVPAADIPITTGPDDLKMQVDEKAYLAGTAQEFGIVGPGPVGCTFLEGAAGPALVDLIEKTTPDLVVMATHGRGPLSRFWLGSVADHVVRHTSTPVLLLHPRDGAPVPAPETKLQTCLVPLDRSAEAEKILGPLVDLAKLTQAHLTLLHVIEPILGVTGAVPPYPLPVPAEAIESLRTDAQKYLDGVADRLRADGLAVATKVIVGLGVAGTVIDQLEQGKIDFVAMTTHGARGFRRLLLGSVADKVVRGAGKPVLVYRPAVAAG